MSTNRDWMYNRVKNGYTRREYTSKVKEFISFAKSQTGFLDGENIRRPCARNKCRNMAFHDEETVEFYLLKFGFVDGYYQWYLHGEERYNHMNDFQETTMELENDVDEIEMPTIGGSTSYHEMVHDLAGSSFNWNRSVEEAPNLHSQQLYDMIDATNERLWPGCENMTKLSAMARLLTIKSNHHLSERAYDDMMQLWKESLPTNNTLVDNFYGTKQLMHGLGLPVEKIDCCKICV
ncbi:hypothetical protein Scep_029969 [Stephania cephalantha]|uniref:Transposase-associated domain-containing protein n=1 Tax=Stephania cephalantha TaxID=152367 RepID=A0AAP0E6H1_9MAGN